MRKLAALATGMLGLTAFIAPAAQADTPTRTTETSGGTITHPFLGPACEQLGISINPVITYQSEETITTFTDADGVTRMQFFGRSTGVIVEESTDKSVEFNSVLRSVDDFPSGETMLVGIRTQYHTPGEGTLFLSAGRTTFTESGVDTVGRNDRGNPDAFREVCMYLASA